MQRYNRCIGRYQIIIHHHIILQCQKKQNKARPIAESTQLILQLYFYCFRKTIACSKMLLFYFKSSVHVERLHELEREATQSSTWWITMIISGTCVYKWFSFVRKIASTIENRTLYLICVLALLNKRTPQLPKQFFNHNTYIRMYLGTYTLGRVVHRIQINHIRCIISWTSY